MELDFEISNFNLIQKCADFCLKAVHDWQADSYIPWDSANCQGFWKVSSSCRYRTFNWTQKLCKIWYVYIYTLYTPTEIIPKNDEAIEESTRVWL